MRQIIKHVLGVYCLIVMCGCTTPLDYVEGTRVSDEQTTSFTKGQSTRDDVVSVLGGPQDIKFEGGKQILVYKYQRISHFAANEASDTTFIFNSKGILEDILKTRGASVSNPFASGARSSPIASDSGSSLVNEAEPASQTVDADPSLRLKTLKDLKESGVLTDEEYQSKRKAIIEKL